MAPDAYIEAHRKDRLTETHWLVEVRWPVVQRITDCPLPISFGGNVFAPEALDVDGVTSDASGIAAGSGSLRIGSGDDRWQTILAALNEGEQHPEVALYEAWLDPSALSLTPQTVRLVRTFTLEAWEADDEEVRLKLAPLADPALGRLPFREYGGGICTYRLFQGPQCAYAGPATSCDRTYPTCTALGNAARFGGFLSLPGEEVTLTWRWQTQNGDLFEETLTLTRRNE